jgi:hypothetical protein
MLFEGGAIGARFLSLLRKHEGDSLTTGDVAGGLTAEIIAGLLGILLSGIALFGVAPAALLPTAALVYGAGLVIGCAALSHTTVGFHEDGAFEADAPRNDAVQMAAGAQLIVGLGAAVMGIAALLGSYTMPLTLAALLFVAASELWSGLSLGARTMRRIREERPAQGARGARRA